ncbi:MAG TPA: hypothetical protein DCL21_05085 [Alphaproteobacteria bacterium]|nr:hypothetical protein [Alphaproteobacteria bacterium]
MTDKLDDSKESEEYKPVTLLEMMKNMDEDYREGRKDIKQARKMYRSFNKWFMNPVVALISGAACFLFGVLIAQALFK